MGLRDIIIIVLYIVIVAGFLFAGPMKNYYFNQIKNIIGVKDTDNSNLLAAIDDINKLNNGTFSLEDSVDN